LLIFTYGIVAYTIGLLGLSLFFLWVGSWEFLPLHVDSQEPGPIGTALLANVTLMLLFGVQHTVMARASFKASIARWIPAAAERSSYVLLSGLLMVAFCFYWQPIAGTLWHIENPTIRTVLLAIQVIGWVIAVLTTFLINHFELFGLQQVYYGLLNQPAPKLEFQQRFLYRIVRHPLQMGLLIGLWSAPTMTMTHVLLSTLMTIYIFIGLHYEELDLVRTLGRPYSEYQKRVRMLLPIPSFNARNDSANDRGTSERVNTDE
jgi:protein-S-isoprenylcysteine O-methyltransferase Ste14